MMLFPGHRDMHSLRDEYSQAIQSDPFDATHWLAFMATYITPAKNTNFNENQQAHKETERGMIAALTAAKEINLPDRYTSTVTFSTIASQMDKTFATNLNQVVRTMDGASRAYQPLKSVPSLLTITDTQTNVAFGVVLTCPAYDDDGARPGGRCAKMVGFETTVHFVLHSMV
jgi:hypothetical protein